MNNENFWKPHKKQVDFLSLPYTVKEAFYGGGAGSAKTETLLYYPLIHKFHENERFKQVFLRRTMPEIRNEVLPRARRIYKPFGATYNTQEAAFTFPSGAKIFLGHCEHETDVSNYDSMEINLFTPDELTSFTEYQYLYIAFERVRSSKNSGLPAIIRAAGMPGGIGHAWVKNRFVTPCPKGGKIFVGRGGIKRIYIHATLADNPYIDPQYAQSLEALPQAERDAKKYGSWDAYLGQVFEEFRDKKYADEPSNALHVIEPFDIPSYWPRIVFMDWGFAPPAMTWVGYGAISPDGRLYVYREQWWQKTKIEEWATEVRYHVDQENPRTIRLCKSAGQDRGQDLTIHQQICNALGRNVELTSNAPGSRVAGKMLLHEYLRWTPKKIHELPKQPYSQEHAEWLLRNKGDEVYRSYCDQYMPAVEETNLPKLQIFNTCPKLIDAIRACTYDKTNPQDVAEFPGDDPYDAIRYGVDIAHSFVNESSDEFKKFQRMKLIEDEFNKDQDWNKVFHKARLMDSHEQEVAISAPRYRRH